MDDFFRHRVYPFAMLKRIWILVLLSSFLFGCYGEPQEFDDEGNMSVRHLRTNRNPPVADIPPHGIIPVVPVIPRDGLWSGYNQLGYQAKYGPDQRATQTILKLDEWGPPEIWTVSLYVVGDFTTFDGFNIKARINFGAGGSTQVYECDWLNGTQISLPMNAVNVEAIFSDVDVTTEGKGLSVGVQLSRGPRGGTNPPRLTLVEDGTFVGGMVTPTFLRLPNFAKRVVAVPSSLNVGTPASFYNSNTFLGVWSGNTAGSHYTATCQGTKAIGNELSVPVVGQARFAALLNGTAAPNDFNATIYVELDG